MQTITTHYHNGSVMAKSWNGWVRSEYDHSVSAEINHRSAAEKLLVKLNARPNVSWEIVASAPGVPGVRGTDGGWVFIIGYKADTLDLNMSITVRFMGATNTGPAYMKAHSWLFPKGLKVHYSPKIADASDIYQCARFAAEQMLSLINEKAGGVCKWGLSAYLEDYKGDRVFSLRSV
jgi:hypothetical protein